MDVVSYEEFYGFFMRSWADIGDITWYNQIPLDALVPMVQWIDCNGWSGNCEKRPPCVSPKIVRIMSEWSFLDLKWSKFQSFLVFRFTKISKIHKNPWNFGASHLKSTWEVLADLASWIAQGHFSRAIHRYGKDGWDGWECCSHLPIYGCFFFNGSLYIRLYINPPTLYCNPHIIHQASMNPPMEIWDIYEWRIVEICWGKPPRIILDIWSSLRSSGHSTCGRCVQSVKPTRTSRGRGQRTVVLPSQGGLDWLDAGTGNKNGNGTTDHSAFDQQSCSFRQNEEICCKQITNFEQTCSIDRKWITTTKHLVSVHWNGTIQPWSTNCNMFSKKTADVHLQSWGFNQYQYLSTKHGVYPPNLGSCKHSLKPIRGQTGNLWLTLTNTQYWLPSWKSATHPCDLWMWGMPRPFQFGPVDPVFRAF